MGHIDFIGPDGTKYPSVTEILGSRPMPWLEKWKQKWGVLAERKTVASQNIGKDFHSGVEEVALGKPYQPKYDRVGFMLGQFRVWAMKVGLKVVRKELHVVSNLYRYHGSFDAIGYLKDKPRTLVIFDWKTSKGIKPEAKLQLAAYAQAYYEEYGQRIHRGVIVNVLKQKPYHGVETVEYEINKRLINEFVKRVVEYYSAHRG